MVHPHLAIHRSATSDVTVGLWSSPGTKPPEIPPDRSPNVIRPEPGQTLWRVECREPIASDLLVTITAKQQRPRATEPGYAGPYPIGPFAVLDVPQQIGLIRVRAPFAVRTTATLKGTTQQEPSEAAGETLYRYRLAESKSPPATPLLELTLSPAMGVVQARIRHDVRLVETGWKLRSEISVSPSRTEVEWIDIELPTDFRPSQAEPREIVEELSMIRESAPDRRVYRARLASPKRSSFAFTLEGEYTVPASQTSASLVLPRLLGVVERSGEIVALAPSRFDLRGSVRTWTGEKVGVWETPDPEPLDQGTRLRGSADRPIAILDLSWRLSPIAASARSNRTSTSKTRGSVLCNA